MTAIFDFIMIAVRDAHGNIWTVVAGDWSNTVQICGMYDKDGKNIYFESDAYHVATWCAENGLQYWSDNRQISVDCF